MPLPAPGQVFRCPCGCGQILFKLSGDGQRIVLRCNTTGTETQIAAVAQVGLLREPPVGRSSG